MKYWLLLFILVLVPLASGVVSYEQTGTQLLNSIHESGIEKISVELNETHTILFYEQPPIKTDADVYLAWIYMFTSVGITDTHSQETVIVQLQDGVPLIELHVPTENIRNLAYGEATFDDVVKHILTGYPNSTLHCDYGELYVYDECETVEVTTKKKPKKNFPWKTILLVVVLVFLLVLIIRFVKKFPKQKFKNVKVASKKKLGKAKEHYHKNIRPKLKKAKVKTATGVKKATAKTSKELKKAAKGTEKFVKTKAVPTTKKYYGHSKDFVVKHYHETVKPGAKKLAEKVRPKKEKVAKKKK